MADQPDTSPPAPARPRSRRRVALELDLDELHEALTIAGYRSAEGSRLLTAVHDLERDVVRVVLEGPAYPICEPGAEPPRFRASDVRLSHRGIADAAAAAVDMVLMPRPVPADPVKTAMAAADLGDGGIGVGMAVST